MMTASPLAGPGRRPVTFHDLLGEPPPRLLLLTGPRLTLQLGTAFAARRLLRGGRVLYVDGANAFDPYILVRIARRAGADARGLLSRLKVSRAFTCHQLETLLCERLAAAVLAERPALVVVAGWGDLFHDENVPEREAMRLLDRTAAAVRRIAARAVPVLGTHLTEPETARLPRLTACLAAAAEGVIAVTREEGEVRLRRVKPPAPALPPLAVEEGSLLPFFSLSPVWRGD